MKWVLALACRRALGRPERLTRLRAAVQVLRRIHTERLITVQRTKSVHAMQATPGSATSASSPRLVARAGPGAGGARSEEKGADGEAPGAPPQLLSALLLLLLLLLPAAPAACRCTRSSRRR